MTLKRYNKARIILFTVDLREKNSDLGSRDEKKLLKLPVDWSFSGCFILISPEQTVKLER